MFVVGLANNAFPCLPYVAFVRGHSFDPVSYSPPYILMIPVKYNVYVSEIVAMARGQ